MNFNKFAKPTGSATEGRIKGILEWLALAHGRDTTEDAGELLQQLAILRDTPVPGPQRVKILDLIYTHTEKIVTRQLQRLRRTTLPVARRIRIRAQATQDILEELTQEYFNSLADIFDPQTPDTPQWPHHSLRRAMYAISWRIRIAQLTASPTPNGAWQQLHAAYRTARRLGLEHLAGPRDTGSIQQIYSAALLLAMAQPASFSSDELDFLAQYIERRMPPLAFVPGAAPPGKAIYWVDPDKDDPAHALIRRMPDPGLRVLYFCCDQVAEIVQGDREILAAGQALTGSELRTPATAGGVLKRLQRIWGQPMKRRFPRRRQSYRANLCIGLENLRQLATQDTPKAESGKWMVINESPDGYALMHVAGETTELRVGDIVAIQVNSEPGAAWQICIIRWAISENPEHLEAGLQVLSSRVIAAKIIPKQQDAGDKVPALILPATPPLRPGHAIVVPTGTLPQHPARLVALPDKNPDEAMEMDTLALDEQNSLIEIFGVSPPRKKSGDD